MWNFSFRDPSGSPYRWDKILFKETAGDICNTQWKHRIHFLLKGKETIMSLTFQSKVQRAVVHGFGYWGHWKMLISPDLNAWITASQITVWLWYLDYIMTSHDKWCTITQSFNHNMLVEVTLVRFRSALGKWAPDSIAGTTLFNVTTVPRKFSIICYVVPSMFMTVNLSSSKLYVNLYVSFMTHGAHEMSGNVISVLPGAWGTPERYNTLKQNQSLTHVCRAEFTHPSC